MYTIVSNTFIIDISVSILDPWISAISKGTGRKYYYNHHTQASEYVIKEDAALDMITAFSTRVQWLWGNAGTSILENQVPGGISRVTMEDFISCNVQS